MMKASGSCAMNTAGQRRQLQGAGGRALTQAALSAARAPHIVGVLPQVLEAALVAGARQGHVGVLHLKLGVAHPRLDLGGVREREGGGLSGF